MNNPTAPIPVEAYKCPKCDAFIFGTKEEASAHVDIPIGNGTLLPVGLVFQKISPKVWADRLLPSGASIKFEKGDVFLINNLRVEFEEHRVFYQISHYKRDREINYTPQHGYHDYDSDWLNEEFGDREFSSLTLADFDTFSRNRPSDLSIGLIRTMPGLEALVAGRKIIA